MNKTISDIYSEYKIMRSLADHMLRVAAVASIICDNFEEPLPKKEIVLACLLHDMGNIIKSDLTCFPEFLEPEGLEYWQGVQNEYFAKYGRDEHEANIKIAKGLDLEFDVAHILDQFRFSLSCEHAESDNMVNKIVHYSDNRVDPHGVVSYRERMEEAIKRYKGKKPFKRPEEERLKLVACGEDIERQIFAKCRIKPEDINNQTAEPVINELRNFVIKYRNES